MKPEYIAQYKTVYGPVRTRKAPDAEAPIVGEVPGGTVLNVVEQDKHWIRCEGYDGWAASTMMERVMDVPAPDIVWHSNGHKFFEDGCRNYFGLQNIGAAIYDGNITLRLYNGERMILEKSYSLTLAPGHGRSFHEKTYSEATRFEVEGAGVFISNVTKGALPQD